LTWYQIMGHKGSILTRRCIKAARARIQLLM